MHVVVVMAIGCDGPCPAAKQLAVGRVIRDDIRGTMAADVAVETNHMIGCGHDHMQIMGDKKHATASFIPQGFDQGIKVFFAGNVHALGRLSRRMVWPVGAVSKITLSQAAAPHLRKTEGCIVNIVDIHADRPMKNYVVYNAAKGGLMSLTRSLARELGPEVRVNGVSPGAILWPEDETWSDELARHRIVSTTLLKRVGEPGDIAKTVRFLIEDAPYITGQIIAVDGGRSVHL